MKVTYRTKLLAIALSGVALVSTPQGAYSANPISGALSGITSKAEEFGASTGISSALDFGNKGLAQYQSIMKQFSQAACEASSGGGLLGYGMGKLKGNIGKLKSKVGGGIGGKLMNGAIDDAMGAIKGRHACIIDGRKEMMIQAMKPYYEYVGPEEEALTIEGMITDYVSDKATEKLQKEFGDEEWAQYVDFGNIVDQAGDCLGGETSTACGSSAGSQKSAQAKQRADEAQAALEATDPLSPDFDDKLQAAQKAQREYEAAVKEHKLQAEIDYEVAKAEHEQYVSSGEISSAYESGDDDKLDNALDKAKDLSEDVEDAKADYEAVKAEYE